MAKSQVKINYSKACEKSGNFTLSQGKFVSLKQKKSEISSKSEFVHLVLALLMIKDGDSFLFNID